MTYVYEELDGEERYTKGFKTLAGATGHAARRLPEARYGYLAADEWTGEYPARRHIVARWKRAGVPIAIIWK